MEDSILITTKKMVGIDRDYEQFDLDIITHINSALLAVNQLGVGPEKGFMVVDLTANWADFLGDDPLLNAVKSYVYLRVRLLFDPPTNAATTTAFKEQLAELEFRISVHREHLDWVDPRKPAPDPEGGVFT